MNAAPLPLMSSATDAPTLDYRALHRSSPRRRDALTAVIPTVGRISLKRAVRSVLRQTLPTTALVVLDRPDREEQVKRLLAGLPHVLVLTPGGLGAAAARNLGVQSAETTHVAFLDDDDEWVAEKSAMQLAVAGDDKLVSSRSLLIGATSRVVPEQLYQPAGRSRPSVVDYVFDRSTLRLRRHFMQTSSLLCSREMALQVAWDEQLTRHQDWDWVGRVERAGHPLQMLPEVLVRVHQGTHGSISRTPDWRASSAWVHSFGAEIDDRARADFLTSVVARDAFASRAWLAGARHLTQGLRAKPHPAAVLVGLSGVVRAVSRGS
ncbi:glycosyltransferase family 2 protein [Nesterenkonia sp. Act20]|uniref:glycosyltransferase family 2 protein n=1 Tax=Nesterenkonia sp. Act20 TaxID=1483432 RepID=UPI001C44EA56|nr:glycosyltransferase family 2 protein [Nesterenkonia sp. Act20]